MIRRFGLWAKAAAMLTVWLTATTVFAEGSPFVGHWQWNRAESKLPPGEAMPEEMFADIVRADPAHVRWSVTVSDKHGKRDVETFDAPGNGEFYPISAGMTASFRLDGPSFDATFKGPAEESDAVKCSLSADQKRMTCNGITTDKGGKNATYVDVYDRH